MSFAPVKRFVGIILIFIFLQVFAGNPVQVQVLDQNNEPITGAKVTVLQNSNALYTNFDGVAQLDVNQPVKEIKVEMMGYAPRIVQLGAQKELNVIRVVLMPDQQ